MNLYGEALAIYRSIGQDRGIAVVLTNLGNLAMDQLDWDRALALQEEALGLYRHIGDHRGVAWSLTNIGAIHRVRGDRHAAFALTQEALNNYVTLGDNMGIAEALEGVGTVMAPSTVAASLLGAAEGLREALGTPLPLSEQAAHNEAVNRVLSVVGVAAFDIAWRTGIELEMEKVVDLALSISIER